MPKPSAVSVRGARAQARSRGGAASLSSLCSLCKGDGIVGMQGRCLQVKLDSKGMESLYSSVCMHTLTLMHAYVTVLQHANTPVPSPQVTKITQANPSLLAPRFFPGFNVQHVLGTGGYGTAYQGKWHDTSVVLKVQDYLLSSRE